MRKLFRPLCLEFGYEERFRTDAFALIVCKPTQAKGDVHMFSLLLLFTMYPS